MKKTPNEETPLRTECDSLGSVALGSELEYGINTHRSLANFDYSGETLSAFPAFLGWLLKVKRCAAQANRDHGKIPRDVADAIVAACDELLVSEQAAFCVDIIEGSCGTSLNMNVNEVLANRALRLMDRAAGEYDHVSPLDHVNYGQSTSDVVITAIRLTLHQELGCLSDIFGQCAQSFSRQAETYQATLRIARTCLQDALPMRVGQGLEGYARLCQRNAESLASAADAMLTVPMGGTAVGSGLGTYDGYKQSVLGYLTQSAGRSVHADPNLFDGIQNLDTLSSASSVIKNAAIAIAKVAGDFVLLSSGPVGGLREFHLPAAQAGSSMMPGKVNPVHAIGLVQASYLVTGLDQCVALSAAGGQLDCNNYLPLIAYSLFKSCRVFKSALHNFESHCVAGLIVDCKCCEEALWRSTALAPALKEVLGYQQVANLVTASQKEGCSLADLVVKENILSEAEVTTILYRSSVSP